MTLRVTIFKDGETVCSITQPGVLAIGSGEHNDLILPRPAALPDQAVFRLVFMRRGSQLHLQCEGIEPLGIADLCDTLLPPAGSFELPPYRFEYEDLRRGGRNEFDSTGTRLIKADAIGIEVQTIALSIVAGPDAGREYPIAGHMLVGASPDCQVSLNDPFLSARHFELFPNEAGVALRDLGSKNGTRVGGVPVTSAVVLPGSRIEAGGSTLLLTALSERRPIEPLHEHVFCGMAARSESMRRVFALIRLLARNDVPVLISGPSGVGKELAARALHDLSARNDGPFIAVNCAALCSQLFESELFGHIKGAFTGAGRDRQGLFAASNGGTLFLDELGELPLELQAKLLRVIEENAVTPVGAERSVPVDVRLIAATNRELSVDVEEKRFREDLFYRVSVFPIQIPALDERPEDIAPIAELLLNDLAPGKRLEPQALEALQSMSWPGNVRQLRNIISRSALLAQGRSVDIETVRQARALSIERGAPAAAAGRTLAEIERAAIMAELERQQGNRARVAQALGIAKSTLYEKLKRYGIAEEP